MNLIVHIINYKNTTYYSTELEKKTVLDGGIEGGGRKVYKTGKKTPWEVSFYSNIMI